MTPFESFLRFVLVFTIFISLSLGLTYAVSTYSAQKEREAQQAAALEALLGRRNEGV